MTRKRIPFTRKARTVAGRIIAWWLARRAERKHPDLATLRKAEAEARRKHLPTRPYQQSRRALVRAALEAERKAS